MRPRRTLTSFLARARSSLRRTALAAGALAALALMPAQALAVSADDIVQLAKAGLGDEVLIALIQTDNTVFPLDAEGILELRAAGVSEAVIVAMLRNGRRPPDPDTTAPDYGWPPPAALESGDFMSDEDVAGQVPPSPEPAARAAAPPIVYMPYPLLTAPPRGPRRAPPVPPATYRGFGRFINDGWVERGGMHRTAP